MTTIHDSPLGKSSAYVAQYDPSLLYPIARSESRKALGLNGALPFFGEDVWTGYELSWLNTKGVPQVALIEFCLPCDSPNIVESKSIKLYLNSFNQSHFSGAAEVQALIAKDLSQAAGATVTVSLRSVSEVDSGFVGFAGAPLNATCLDDLDIHIDEYTPNPNLLSATSGEGGSFFSNLLKSNCPVTGQPDWASVWVSCTGVNINPEGLLRYIVSYREHQDFHEHCVERMFCDVLAQCQPTTLEVYARYTRRGGLDINPYRTTAKQHAPKLRLIRQ